MKFVICLALASAFLHSTNAEAPLLRQQASFTTIEDLQLLTSDFNGSPGETFEFQHPEFHGKKLGIKQHDGDWCDSVKSYSGYIDAGHGKEMFFTFFESRHDPKNDPVVM
jgi:cathepsin A (carboxypeptidase C)